MLSFIPADAAPKKDFKVCWSIYVGWMPWGHLQSSGIMKKWADKYGITVDVAQINDYVESINQYTAGAYDGCTMTNMDALSIPAGGGVDTTALIVGDYSNGNDGILLKGKSALADIKGQKVNLVELSVSHYLLARALEGIKLSEKDLTLVNTSDADIASAYATPDVTAAVTWNPMLSDLAAAPNTNNGVRLILYSRRNHRHHDGEHRDAEGEPQFRQGAGRRLVRDDGHHVVARRGRHCRAHGNGESLRHRSGRFRGQLKTTQMFYKPADAVAFTKDAKLATTMQFVAKFLFDHGILGQGATGPDFVGVEFSGGKFVGDKSKVTLRFDPTYMEMAAAGKL